MLKDGTLTSVREFVCITHKVTDLTRWAWTEYAIKYDGSNECMQDIAIFTGGFAYGTLGENLQVMNTILLRQGRIPHDCIDELKVGDWVVLACGKVFVANDAYFARNREELPIDWDRFMAYYGNVQFNKRKDFGHRDSMLAY